MRVLLSSTAVEGHLAPLTPLAAAMRQQGHAVGFATAQTLEQRLTRGGFLWFRAGIEPDELDARFESVWRTSALTCKAVPIDKKADWSARRALLTRAEVRIIRLHDARHTSATLLLSAGVHPQVVMALLGHSQMRTTTNTCSHVMPALAREAADRLSETLWD